MWVLICVPQVVALATPCTDAVSTSVQVLYDQIVEISKNFIPTIVDHMHLDPESVPVDGYYDLMTISPAKKACEDLCMIKLKSCVGFGVTIDSVVVRGLRDLRVTSLQSRKCMKIAPGGNCTACPVTTGDSIEGYDLDWELRVQDTLAADISLEPVGVQATCRSWNKKDEKINLWSGTIHCATQPSDAVVAGNTCVAICAPYLSPLCVACKKLTSVAFHLLGVKCSYHRTGGIPGIHEISRLLDQFLIPRLTKALEDKAAALLKQYVDDMKLSVPSTCSQDGNVMDSDGPEVNKILDLIRQSFTKQQREEVSLQ